MKILFKSPELKNSETELEFKQSLESVTAYKGVEEKGTHCLLELHNTFEVDTLKQLFALFEKWDIDPSPLVSFVQYVEMEAQKNSGS